MTVQQWYDEKFPRGLPMVVETENEIRRTFIGVLTQYENEVVFPLRQAAALWTQDKANLMASPPRMREFEKWKTTLPKCLSYAGGCDGDLEGLEHNQECPMFGKKFATHLDAFTAAWQAAQPSSEKIEEVARRIEVWVKTSSTTPRISKSEIAAILREELGGGKE